MLIPIDKHGFHCWSHQPDKMLPLRSSFLDPWTGPKRCVGRKNLKSLAQFLEGIIGHEAVLDGSWLQIGVNSPSYWGSWSPVMNMFEMGSWICQTMQLIFCFLTWDLWFWDYRVFGRFGWLNEWWSWLNRELPPWIFTTLKKHDGNQLGRKWSSEMFWTSTSSRGLSKIASNHCNPSRL